MGSPFSVGAERTEVLEDPRRWAECFTRERAIVCHDVFEPRLSEKLFAAACRTAFKHDHVAELGTREVEQPQRVGGTINLLFRRPNLLRWLELVSGHAHLAGVEGRLVQSRPGGDALDWHNDLQGPGRALGITIGFTDTAYSGGLFEMRRLGDPQSARTFSPTKRGTALIFDLGGDLEHCVHPVSGGGPRRVFTGWFMRSHALAPLLA